MDLAHNGASSAGDVHRMTSCAFSRPQAGFITKDEFAGEQHLFHHAEEPRGWFAFARCAAWVADERFCGNEFFTSGPAKRKSTREMFQILGRLESSCRCDGVVASERAPSADSNGDGRITEEELKSFMDTLSLRRSKASATR
jgi:hypothetical protein